MKSVINTHLYPPKLNQMASIDEKSLNGIKFFHTEPVLITKTSSDTNAILQVMF